MYQIPAQVQPLPAAAVANRPAEAALCLESHALCPARNYHMSALAAVIQTRSRQPEGPSGIGLHWQGERSWLLLVPFFQSHRRAPLSRRTGGRGRATPHFKFLSLATGPGLKHRPLWLQMAPRGPPGGPAQGHLSRWHLTAIRRQTEVPRAPQSSLTRATTH